jgi:hypothetical protein
MPLAALLDAGVANHSRSGADRMGHRGDNRLR